MDDCLTPARSQAEFKFGGLTAQPERHRGARARPGGVACGRTSTPRRNVGVGLNPPRCTGKSRLHYVRQSSAGANVDGAQGSGSANFGSSLSSR
jgi:hypothetical protein